MVRKVLTRDVKNERAKARLASGCTLGRSKTPRLAWRDADVTLMGPGARPQSDSVMAVRPSAGDSGQ